MKSTVAGSVTRARKPLAFGLVLVAALVAVMLVLVATKPAGAAFPGSNGQIVFYSADSIAVGDPSSSDTEIFSMNSNGTGLTQLTSNAVQDFNPAWSPDGTEIVFESRRDDPNGEIYKMPANGSPNPRRLTNNAASDFDPAWSPDGMQIAFHSDRDANGEIYTMNANGSGQTRRTLTGAPAHENNPDWQPGP